MPEKVLKSPDLGLLRRRGWRGEAAPDSDGANWTLEIGITPLLLIVEKCLFNEKLLFFHSKSI